MQSREQRFVLQIQFLKQLFPRAEAGELNLYIFVRLQPRKQNKIPGKIHDLDRFSHIEEEHISTFAEAERLQQKLGRLRDRHEIASHFRMGDRYWTTRSNLFLEDWNDAPIASKHVAKTHRNELRVTLQLKCSDHDLRHSLAGAHHACRSNSFIGGNHHEIFHPVLDRGKRSLPRPKDIVIDGGKHVVFHHWNMLVGCGMIENRRSILFHHVPQVFRVGNIPDLRMKCYTGEVLTQFSVNLEEWSFRHVESDQSQGTKSCNLAA